MCCRPASSTWSPATGQTVGDALVTHPGIRRLAFIGAATTGRSIQARAASVAVKHVSLELGGKNPIVVFNDADLEAAVDGAIRGMNFTWQGQSCGSTSRVIVQREIYDDFVDLLAAHRLGSQARLHQTTPTRRPGP